MSAQSVKLVKHLRENKRDTYTQCIEDVCNFLDAEDLEESSYKVRFRNKMIRTLHKVIKGKDRVIEECLYIINSDHIKGDSKVKLIKDKLKQHNEITVSKADELSGVSSNGKKNIHS